MKIFTFVAALCLIGMSSCSQKTCPAYSKAGSAQPHTLAKEPASAQAGQARI
ncbi:MAG: hypothetical protein ACO1NZ_17660 [Adhaeribacter sp.]